MRERAGGEREGKGQGFGAMVREEGMGGEEKRGEVGEKTLFHLSNSVTRQRIIPIFFRVYIAY